MYEEVGNSTLLMLLNTAVYPFLVAAVVTLLSKRIPRFHRLGLAAGFLVALSLIHLGLNFPPSKALDFLVVSVLLGLSVSYIGKKCKVGDKTLTLVTLIVLFISFYCLLNPVLKHQGQPLSVVWSSISACVVMVIYRRQQHTAEKTHSHAAMSSLAIVAATAAPVVSIGGSLLIGQLLGGFAASVMGFVLIQKFALKQSSFSGVLLGSFILSGLLAQAHVLADLPLGAMLLAYSALWATVWSRRLIQEDGSVSATIVALLPQVIVSSMIAGLSLWTIWPESSLY